MFTASLNCEGFVHTGFRPYVYYNELYPCCKGAGQNQLWGFLPLLSSLRMISSKSVISANKISAEKNIFGTKTLFLAPFGPV